MIILYIIAGLVLLILILGMIAPSEFAVSRDIVVNKPQKAVWDSLISLKEQQEWSVWGTRDPNMRTEFKGTDGEVGAIHLWFGNKQVGEGEQELTKLVPMTRVESELRFLKPWKATNMGYFDLKAEGNGTHVTWGFSGKSKFPMSIMMLFMNMDKAIGKDFEEGLSNFKTYIEKK
ncbi:MAG: SRPBCC family protein [Bacteroidales bacterium]|nr:SRPBCC family protein [Bacteroidales bacterium]MCF8457300.1 SRPBCC family protein [Bacteroidales bacterium]